MCYLKIYHVEIILDTDVYTVFLHLTPSQEVSTQTCSHALISVPGLRHATTRKWAILQFSQKNYFPPAKCLLHVQKVNLKITKLQHILSFCSSRYITC